MEKIHFLNVNNGDCILIQHVSGRNTVVDICNGNAIIEKEKVAPRPVEFNECVSRGNFNQKNHPTNPIEYFREHNVKDIFRFILTHPDMDHMDGIENLFKSFDVINFWDTDNRKQSDGNFGQFKKSDWDFYQSIRINGKGCTVLRIKAGAKGIYYNQDDMNGTGDGIYILSPTDELIALANQSGDYNEISLVLLWVMNNGRKVVFAGDSGEVVWDSIIEKYSCWLSNIDVLIAPHHGRKTGGNDNYLDVLKPKLTLFGNANSEHLDYDSFSRRKLCHITNNQAGNVMICESGKDLDVYVSNENFALTFGERDITLDLECEGYYHILTI